MRPMPGIQSRCWTSSVSRSRGEIVFTIRFALALQKLHLLQVTFGFEPSERREFLQGGDIVLREEGCERILAATPFLDYA